MELAKNNRQKKPPVVFFMKEGNVLTHVEYLKIFMFMTCQETWGQVLLS